MKFLDIKAKIVAILIMIHILIFILHKEYKAYKATHQIPKSSIVALYSIDGQFRCSGTVIDKDKVLTAAHCILDGIPILVRAPDSPDMVLAVGFYADQRSDQAILVGDFSKWANRIVPIEQDPEKILSAFAHDKLVTCGFPYSGPLFCNPIKHHNPDDEKPGLDALIEGGAWLFAGMSGGPVWDMDTGMVIGVNTATDSGKAYFAPLIDILYNLGLQKL